MRFKGLVPVTREVSKEDFEATINNTNKKPNCIDDSIEDGFNGREFTRIYSRQFDKGGPKHFVARMVKELDSTFGEARYEIKEIW